jgi:hypothetical protein
MPLAGRVWRRHAGALAASLSNRGADPPVPIASIAGLDGYREAWTAAVNLIAR